MLPVTDPHGRPLRDLRISVTRDCQMACYFCHHEGVMPGPAEMSPGEIGRLVRIGARLGVRSVKITGGEPLLRRDFPAVVRAVGAHVDEVSLVTNGHLLGRRARDLLGAGLHRANVSIHTLDPARYQEITRTPGPPLQSLLAARAAGLDVKANMVVTRRTLDQVLPVVEWGQRTGIPIQLIELHGPPQQWPLLEGDHVSLEPVEAWLVGQASHVSRHRMHGRPRYHLAGTTVDVTRPMGNWQFCASCSRLRITTDGRLQTCLLQPRFVEVLSALRGGCDDAAVEALVRQAMRMREPTWVRPVPVVEAVPRC